MIRASDYYHSEDLIKSAGCYEVIARLHEELGKKENAAKAWVQASIYYYHSEDYGNSARCAEKGALLDEEMGDITQALKGWNLAGASYIRAEMVEDAIRCSRKTVRLDRQLKTGYEGRSLIDLSTRLSLADKLLEAAEVAEEAALFNNLKAQEYEKDFPERNNFLIYEINALASARSLYVKLAQERSDPELYKRAAIVCEKSAEICNELGNRSREALCWSRAGKMWGMTNEYERSIMTREKAASLYDQIGDYALCAALWALMAISWKKIGIDEKVGHCDRIAANYNVKQDERGMAIEHYLFAARNFDKGNKAGLSNECMERAIEIIEKIIQERRVDNPKLTDQELLDYLVRNCNEAFNGGTQEYLDRAFGLACSRYHVITAPDDGSKKVPSAYIVFGVGRALLSAA